MQPLAHFKTITHHRHLVCRYCFRLGLYRQGLLHDLSKYAPCEFWRGAKYYQGYRSPNDAERKQNGVSLAWLHQRDATAITSSIGSTTASGRTESLTWAGAKCRCATSPRCSATASRRAGLTSKDKYTDAAPYDYYIRSKSHILIHPRRATPSRRCCACSATRGRGRRVRLTFAACCGRKRKRK